MSRWVNREGQFWEEWLRVVDEPHARQIISAFRDNPRYLRELTLLESQSVYKDRYGDVCFDEWHKALAAFTKSKFPAVAEAKRNAEDYDSALFLVQSILWRIRDELGTPELPVLQTSVSDSAAFEGECAKVLEGQGFTVTITGATGDQGADVIGERDGFRVAIQCKLHSAPVGNAAVQEIEAARNYYRCHQGIVVSRSGFTKSAQKLAAALNVELLDYSDLAEAF